MTAKRQGPDTKARKVVASYESYREAERAVDHLSDVGFPVERVSIVGRGLHLVEQVTGRMTLGQAALRGAVTGALTGALVGWIFGIFDWTDPIIASALLALHGLWFGGIVGALIGMAVHAMQRGRRDFSSVGMMSADHYELLVDEEVAEEAARLLAQMEDAPREAVRTGSGASGTTR